MPDKLITDGLEVGRNYRVIYQNPAERLPREMVAKFMSAEKDGVFFSLRPIAGTVGLTADWVKEIWTTTLEVHEPVIHRKETRLF